MLEKYLNVSLCLQLLCHFYSSSGHWSWILHVYRGIRILHSGYFPQRNSLLWKCSRVRKIFKNYFYRGAYIFHYKGGRNRSSTCLWTHEMSRIYYSRQMKTLIWGYNKKLEFISRAHYTPVPISKWKLTHDSNLRGGSVREEGNLFFSAGNCDNWMLGSIQLWRSKKHSYKHPSLSSYFILGLSILLWHCNMEEVGLLILFWYSHYDLYILLKLLLFWEVPPFSGWYFILSIS